MAAEYASKQPAGFKNHIEKVAIVGAGGHVGKFITESLLETGKHTVTALTRAESSSTLPGGVHVVTVDYGDPATLVAALKGQDALIITMGVMAPAEQQSKLIAAAAEAGVPWVMPNEWGGDGANTQQGADTFLGPRHAGYRAEIEAAGISSWVSLVCGFWYEFSLAGGVIRYGFDLKARKLRLFDDGRTPINTSTWPQVGRAVARLLSLKVLPDDERDEGLCLAKFRNAYCYVSSFTISQRDMFESVLRVTGTEEKDWDVSREPVKSVYERGIDMFKKGDMAGFGQLLYARAFYPEDSADYGAKRGLQNEALGLPEESLDEATKVAMKLAEDFGYIV